MTKDLSSLKHEFASALKDILLYWMTNAVDNANGGFHGRIDHFNNVVGKSTKGAVLNTRILRTFATCHIYFPKQEYLELAKSAYDYILRHFVDKEHGGLIWEVDYLGKPLNGRKQIYAQAFGIYGFSAFYRASGVAESLQLAKQLFVEIERHSFDKVHDGYIECLAQDWKPIFDMRLSEKDQNYPKTMNTHLHILEAYASLYQVWKDEQLERKLRSLIRIFLDRIIDEDGAHLHLFFADDWTTKSNIVSFGHDIEAAWLLTEAAEVLGDQQLLKEVQPVAVSLANAALKDGMDSNASLYYEWDKNAGHFDKDKHWWPQAEGLIGLMNAYQISGDEQYLQSVLDLWAFTKARMIDYKHGEWYWKTDRFGTPYVGEDKVGFWKCPYHNSRACLEMMRRIDQLI